MFHSLMEALKAPMALDRTGFFVSDVRFFNEFRSQHLDIDDGTHTVLKEWEIVDRAYQGAPDLDRIKSYEEILGEPTLWGPIIADRRVSLGKRCSFYQDYTPRFNHDQMLHILEESLFAFEKLFDEVRPDFVVSFICVTLGEYLGYLFAKARNIPFLNLRPTRIRNFVTYGERIFEPSERIRSRYQICREQGIDEPWKTEAVDYLAELNHGLAKYEGVIPPSRTPHSKKVNLEGGVQKLFRLMKSEYDIHFGRSQSDNHVTSWTKDTFYRRLNNPRRARQMHRKFASLYVKQEDLDNLDYVFFPLHTEPEVTLLVYSPWALNQVEFIRNLSQSIPVGMSLVVKEHPASIGKRPLSYYEKLLQIPNVRLADPSLNSRALVENARLIATIAGSIGLEALLRKKPVITYGRTPYDFLPDTMIRRVGRLDRLGDHVKDLMHQYQCDEDALRCFVSAVMCESAPINLYSNLLSKKDVYTIQQSDGLGESEWDRDIKALGEYTIASFNALQDLGQPQSS